MVERGRGKGLPLGTQVGKMRGDSVRLSNQKPSLQLGTW